VLLGLKLQVDSLGSPEQAYDTGAAVVELDPLVTMNPVVLATVRFTVPDCPCVTDSVPPVRLEVRENVSVVAVTVKLTVVELDTAPLVPFTVTETLLAAAILGDV